MADIEKQFKDFDELPSGKSTYALFSSVQSGEVSGSTSATTAPDIAGKLFRIKAHSDNAGNVYFGDTGVTVADGTTDTTSGFPLAASEDTGWIPISNLNIFQYICDNAGDDWSYLVLG